MSSYVTHNPGYEVYTVPTEGDSWLAGIRGPDGKLRAIPYVYLHRVHGRIVIPNV